MPRPPRTRRAPAKEAPAANVEDTTQSRGRTRSTRSSLQLDSSMIAPRASRAASRSQAAAVNNQATDEVDAPSDLRGANHDDTRSPVEVGRRHTATPAQRRDTTGLDLADEDIFGDLDDSFGDDEEILPKVPQSAESSSFSGLRRPRSRQSSIIGRNDPPIRPSSRGGMSTPGVSSSFNIGMFRRRAREPSILGTTRKALHDTTTSTAAADGAGDDSDLDLGGEFAPDAESTPVNNRRRTRASLQAERTTALEESARPNTRKRKSGEGLEEDNTRAGKVSRVEQDVDSDSDISSLASPSPPRAARLERSVTPMNLEGLGAPPASSDSEGDDQVWPDIHNLARKRRRPSITTPLRADDVASDVSSPPSLTHSPNFGASKSRAHPVSKRKASPKVTTADLASLLPKRRYHGRASVNASEILDETAASDADTEDHVEETSRSARRKPSNTQQASKPAADPPLQEKQAPAGPVRRSQRVSARTYSRRSADKENEATVQSDDEDEEPSAFVALPDDTFDGTTVEDRTFLTAEELKQAAKKFKEVDRWEMEFEEATEPPSPQNAR